MVTDLDSRVGQTVDGMNARTTSVSGASTELQQIDADLMAYMQSVIAADYFLSWAPSCQEALDAYLVALPLLSNSLTVFVGILDQWPSASQQPYAVARQAFIDQWALAIDLHETCFALSRAD